MTTRVSATAAKESMRTTADDRPDGLDKRRCYGCFRPAADCFCAAIPEIDNRTEVLILQHRREQFHPFNTARIVRKALRNSQLVVGHPKLLAAELLLKPGAGLLYPGPNTALLSDVPSASRPEQLVILDGTWHHAKTLLRDIPALHELPRYRLAPTAPSRFRIRREPSAVSLSTVEATIDALRMLEPDTAGLDRLLDAFLGMVDRQFEHPKAEYGWRSNSRRGQTFRNIPRALLGDLDHVVVAYGESTSRDAANPRALRPPVYWVAERLGTGERFCMAIEPQFRLEPAFLDHLELTENDFAEASSLEQAREAWRSFVRPDDSVAVFNQSVARLLVQLSDRGESCLVLKSVDFDSQRRYGTLEELLMAEGLSIAPARHHGRAGKRLAVVAAFVRHLHALGNAVVSARSEAV